MRGSCLCGTIGFEVRGDLPKAYQCHCSLCRKQGGSSSNAALIVEAGNFSWISGQESIQSFIKPTGFRSDFCSRCGSPVPNPLRSTPYYWVPAGLIDGDSRVTVGAHLFVASKAPWDTIPAGGRRYETMPELAELIRFLSSGR